MRMNVYEASIYHDALPPDFVGGLLVGPTALPSTGDAADLEGRLFWHRYPRRGGFKLGVR